jgi:hypothetical protein
MVAGADFLVICAVTACTIQYPMMIGPETTKLSRRIKCAALLRHLERPSWPRAGLCPGVILESPACVGTPFHELVEVSDERRSG